MNVTEAHAEIEIALPKVLWRRCALEGAPPDTRGFSGDMDGWYFLVVIWAHGADGTATKGGLIIHLTPELARKAGALAQRPQ